jgi:hypothetical protein
MQENPTLTPMQQDAQQDAGIISLLVDVDATRPWSFEGIAREIGSNPTDSLRRLYGGGLIHRLDGFVWATRAAVMADEIRL